jgi:hypothetical protein
MWWGSHAMVRKGCQECPKDAGASPRVCLRGMTLSSGYSDSWSSARSADNSPGYARSSRIPMQRRSASATKNL